MVHPGQAVWVTKELVPQPRDIYDIPNQAVEALCRDFFEQEGQDATVLRVGRFLPEPANLAANHQLHRGLDERDGAQAHLLALEKSFDTFEVFNIASGSPFGRSDVAQLRHNPAPVICHRLPEATGVYQRLGWQFPTSIDRVYCIDKAQRRLGYAPQYTASYLLREAMHQAGSAAS